MASNMQLLHTRFHVLTRNNRFELGRVRGRHQCVQRLDEEVEIEVSKECNGITIRYNLDLGVAASRGGRLHDPMHGRRQGTVEEAGEEISDYYSDVRVRFQ